LNGSGQASFSTSSLTAGNHAIVAKYGGDGSFNPSQSANLIQVVNTCSVSGFMLEGPQGTLNVSVAGKHGIVNTDLVRFVGPDGSFPLSNSKVTSCANPDSANGMAVITGQVGSGATGAYHTGDQVSITVWANGPDGGPEASINDTTQTHTYLLKSQQTGVGKISVTVP
jgi:hypothetical protein